MSILKPVSIVAACAISGCLVPGVALVAHLLAGLSILDCPEVAAFTSSTLFHKSSAMRNILASTINQVVVIDTASTISICIPFIAIWINFWLWLWFWLFLACTIIIQNITIFAAIALILISIEIVTVGWGFNLLFSTFGRSLTLASSVRMKMVTIPAASAMPIIFIISITLSADSSTHPSFTIHVIIVGAFIAGVGVIVPGFASRVFI